MKSCLTFSVIAHLIFLIALFSMGTFQEPKKVRKKLLIQTVALHPEKKKAPPKKEEIIAAVKPVVPEPQLKPQLKPQSETQIEQIEEETSEPPQPDTLPATQPLNKKEVKKEPSEPPQMKTPPPKKTNKKEVKKEVPPKKKDVAKKTPKKEVKKEVKKETAKAPQPPAAPKKKEVNEKAVASEAQIKKQGLIREAQEKLAKLSSTKDNSSTKPTTSIVIPSYEEGTSHREADTKDERYIAALIKKLRLSLKLPQRGEAEVQLELERSGAVLSTRVICSTNPMNRAYLEKELPKIKFPPFGESFSS